MHTLLHYGIRIGFVVFIVALFITLFIQRPGSTGKPTSKRTWAGLVLVGLIIAAVFYETQTLYQLPPAIS